LSPQSGRDAASGGASAPDRIVLVGFMGVGKTTVGHVLAEQLGWTFGDLDDWIVDKNGCSVAEIFRDKGEPFFREQERLAAEATRQLRRHVVGAGGGAFVQPATRDILRQDAKVVWLSCDLDAVLHRIKPDGSRPLAADRERMQALMAQREASYRMADLAMDTTNVPPEQVAADIVAALFPRTRG
jgi:shikimate kinase